jgi:positive regulator of sigma E activity
VGNDLSIETGQYVEVFVPPVRAIKSGFLVLILPLILFVVGYLVSASLETEALRVLSGLGGLVVGFVLVFIFGRSHQADLPMITAVHETEDFEPVRMPR